MFQTAAEKLGCRTDQIAHVGDSAADILGARRAGARAIWLNRKAGTLPRGTHRSDAEISTLAQLPTVLTRMSSDREVERRPDDVSSPPGES
jgi:FMN hydrolase / 5-amino-6-(5-phospho-D-ribitylamino)uracil phosphatase